jgi:hypothetical protein
MQILFAGIVLIIGFPICVQLLLLVLSNPVLAIAGAGVGLCAMAR